MIAMAAITEATPDPMIATTRIDSSTGGNAIQISTRRETTTSVAPRRYPAKSPSSVPIKAASAAAANATTSATRVPKIRRESTSRPRSSVPNTKPGSDPARPRGGNVPAKRSCASGSCGAISGANNASTSKSKMNPPPKTTFGCASSAPTSLRPTFRCREPCASASWSRRASAMAKFRVEGCDHDVNQQIDQNKERSEDQHQPLNERKIAIDHGVDSHRTDARISEDALYDHRAADQKCELNAGESKRRADRVAKRLAGDQAQLRHAFDACNEHVVLQHGLTQRFLEDADDDRRQRQREGERGHDQ